MNPTRNETAAKMPNMNNTAWYQAAATYSDSVIARVNTLTYRTQPEDWRTDPYIWTGPT